MNKFVRIAVTAGEPAGIGPDLCVALKPQPDTEFVVIADPALLKSRGTALGQSVNLNHFDPLQPAEQVSILPLECPTPSKAGTLDSANSAYVLESISAAVDGCKNNLFDAMVTAPVHKGVINDAGIPFSGHTEYIAELLNATPLMVLAADNLRVALVTTHLPLKNVADAITKDAIIDCLRILNNDCLLYTSPSPRD